MPISVRWKPMSTQLLRRRAKRLPATPPASGAAPDVNTTTDTDSLHDICDDAFARLRQAREAFTPVAADPGNRRGDPGRHRHRPGRAACPAPATTNCCSFPGDLYGLAFNLDEDEIGVVLLGDHARLQAGDEVHRTGRVMDVAVGDGLLGRVIDPLGRVLDGGAALAAGDAPADRATGAARSWIAHRSACRCSPGSRWSMR